MHKLCRRMQFGTEAKKEIDDTSETEWDLNALCPVLPVVGRERVRTKEQSSGCLPGRELAGLPTA